MDLDDIRYNIRITKVQGYILIIPNFIIWTYLCLFAGIRFYNLFLMLILLFDLMLISTIHSKNWKNLQEYTNKELRKALNENYLLKKKNNEFLQERLKKLNKKNKEVYSNVY